MVPGGGGGVRGEVAQATRDLWIALNRESLFWLAEALALHRTARRRGFLLVLFDVPLPLCSLFADRFERFVVHPEILLPLNELAAVLAREDRAEFCIGGTVVSQANMVSLVRGDLSTLNVPLSVFGQRGTGPAPDPGRFDVIDHGRTLRFGDYEASFDAVLYELDSDYRRRLNRLRLERDSTLGGSLRRLRKQRGLRLADMGSLAKTVARIERGRVSRPRKSSLAAIARILDVVPEQIIEY